ncbi:hypothetical protein RCL_jg28424.t1 [Rhizophagus clarus]|uniref:Uncharacterized protein n=1 Tax=Rhizophagus clarus TaxID=94130 RepID=A0A8H3M6L0_9GLOM|nr:hypothetical protein RCL_jg28424.t1 [Rhizophagus clarus]
MMRLSNEQRVEVITLIEERYSSCYIANKMDVYQSTVLLATKEYSTAVSIQDKIRTDDNIQVSTETVH